MYGMPACDTVVVTVDNAIRSLKNVNRDAVTMQKNLRRAEHVVSLTDLSSALTQPFPYLVKNVQRKTTSPKPARHFPGSNTIHL